MSGVQYLDDKLGPPSITVDGETEARRQRRQWRYTGGPTITDDPATGEQTHDFAAVVPGGPLVSAAARGSVGPYPAGVANTFFCSDGTTAGGSWRTHLSLGTAPPLLGSMRWSAQTNVRGLDHAGTGEAQLIDWGDTIADHLTIGSNNANLDGVDIVGGATGTVDVRVGAATNLRVSATTVSTPANAIWSLGTNYVTHGAAPATAGTFRREDTANDTWLNGGNNYALCSGQGTTAILGGPYPTRPTTAAVDAATTTELRVAGTALVSCTASAVAVGVNSLAFGATLSTPTVGQTADSTASVIC